MEQRIHAWTATQEPCLAGLCPAMNDPYACLLWADLTVCMHSALESCACHESGIPDLQQEPHHKESKNVLGLWQTVSLQSGPIQEIK